MASFIAIPLKKTSEVDLVKPIKNVFSGFCVVSEEPVCYDDAINELNKLRVNSTWRTLDKHENSLDVMTRYYDQLNFLDAKCPGVEFQVSFKWKDAFDKGSFFLGSASLTQSTLAFEKTCMLFNIAAMQSQVACGHISDTKNDEGLKLSAKYFQMAAGTFLEVRSQGRTIAEPTPDLRAETLSALSAIMLAQAQEAFFFKATSDNMKETVISKLASRAEELYTDALRQMQKESVVHLWDKDWLQIVSGKQAGLLGVSEYYQALVCKSKKDVGEELARLQKAMDVLKTADQKAVLPPELKDYLPRITHNYEEAKKDNDFIYHARVPDASSLAPIGKAPLAKPFFPGPQTNSESKDLFEKLLPLSVQQAVSAFELRKAEIINPEKAKLQGETQMLNGILASLNLPAALEDTKGEGLPPSILEKAQAIKAEGGIEALQSLLRELPDLLQRNSEIIKESDRMLKEEEDTDAELKAKFGTNWQRTPSGRLNQPLKDNLEKYNQIIKTANAADSVVNDKFNKHKDKISLLCIPEDQLISSIPAGNPVRSCPSVERLRALMREVDSLKAAREELLSELDSSITDMNARFLTALKTDGALDEATMSTNILTETYNPIREQISLNLKEQERLVNEIQAASSEFAAERNKGSDANQREVLLCDMAAAHDAFVELKSNLEEGSKFYNHLTEVLVSFQNKINDFCFARKTEREDIVKSLQKMIVDQPTPPTPIPPAHHNIAAAQRPARPPPPRAADTPSAPTTQTPYPYPQAHTTYPFPEGTQVAPLPYPVYNYPFASAPNPYNPYGQIVMQPYPPAPGYQGQQAAYPPQQQPGYSYPQQQQQQPGYPYPQQQYRPWSQ